MKKVLMIVGIVLIVLIMGIVSLPFIYKGKIKQIVFEKIDNTIDAQVVYGDYSLSLLKSFPNFEATFNDFAIIGKGDFEGDTLIGIGKFAAVINIKSVFKGDGILIESVGLDDVLVNLIFSKEEKANWDIMKEVANVSVETTESAPGDPVQFLLKKIDVSNLDVIYTDYLSDYQFSMLGTSGSMKGNFEGMIAKLDIQAVADAVSFIYEGVGYLENRKVDLATSLIADFETFDFQFEADKSRLNQIPLSIKGGFAMPTDTMKFDIHFDAPELSMKQVLDLVPSAYAGYMKDLKASGDVSLNGSLIGDMIGDVYPAMDFKFDIKNGEIKHPQLPDALKINNMEASLSKAEGDLDLLEFGIQDFNMVLANNPLSMRAHFSSIMTDPLLDVMLKGVIDFEALTKLFPVDSMIVKGLLNADAALKGRYSAIEQNQFDQFNSSGKLQLTNFQMTNSSFPDGVTVSNAGLTLNNQTIVVSGLKGKIGQSDFALNGKVDQVIAWFMDKGELQGQFQLNSNLFDLNQFLTKDEAMPKSDTIKTKPVDKTPANTTPVKPLEFPKNMNLSFNASINQLLYSKMNITNFNGGIVLKDQVLTLTGLRMNMFKGELSMTGKVIADGRKDPDIDLALKINGFDLPSTYHDVSMVQKFMPFAAKSQGEMSTTLSLKSKVSSNLNMILESITAGGTLSMNHLKLLNTSGLDQLKSLVKIDELKDIDVKDFDAIFQIENGNLILKPFNTELAKQPVTVGGTMNLAGKMNFRIDGQVETRLLSSGIQSIISAIPGSQKMTKIDLGFDLTGDAKKPQVKFDNEKIRKQVAAQLKNVTAKDVENAARDLLKRFTK